MILHPIFELVMRLDSSRGRFKKEFTRHWSEWRGERPVFITHGLAKSDRRRTAFRQLEVVIGSFIMGYTRSRSIWTAVCVT